ncbi:MAG: nucleotidyl transferase AbiEii/AbiGii toxin family protein [Betaproteobacteria bacterium]|nr:nucleotidyl transferase AbiEii/AbiGii toxin family protein [Betaproteobacteria bacterium]MDE2424120.1 nucleotidyl transferase AbiEii/AbiGii toxin family protein [Betaproteobacteria bacterium]
MSDKYVKELALTDWVNDAPPSQRNFREAVHIVLSAISTSASLRHKMVMKGGQLMAIRYDSTRFTRDVDFSTRDKYTKADHDSLLSELDAQIQSANDQLPYDTMCRRQATKLEPSRDDASFPTLSVSIGFAPRSKPLQLAKLKAGQSPTVVQIDYSYNEAVYDIETLSLLGGDELLAYSLNNLLAEKLRSLLQQPVRKRNRRQDVYDLHMLLTQCKPLSAEELLQVKTHLVLSCKTRHIDAVRTSISDPRVRQMAAKEYESLADEIEEELPGFDAAFEIVQRFYEALPW